MKRITLFKKSLPVFLACLSVVILLESTFHELSVNASAETQEVTTQTVLAEETDTAYVEQEEYQTVVSYMDVFEAYYRQASERLSDGNIEMPYTFEEFCDGYYTFNMEIQAYTDLIVDEAYGRVSMVEYEVSLASSALPSSDEDYIIKGDTADPNITASFDPETTPYDAIQRDIYYTLFDFSAIREGDIILETALRLMILVIQRLFMMSTSQQAFGRLINAIEYMGNLIMSKLIFKRLRLSVEACNLAF